MDPRSIPISKLVTNPEDYKKIIAEGRAEAQKKLKSKEPGRVFNNYPGLLDDKTFKTFVTEAKSLMEIPRRSVDIVTGVEEPEDTELKEMDKTKARVKHFYDQIIEIACQDLLNPKKREVDTAITTTLISDEKGLKPQPIATLLSLIENIVRSIMLEINEEFKLDFYKKWNKEDVEHYQALTVAIQAYEATKSADEFKMLQPPFTLVDYAQKEFYLHSHFGETFINDYAEQFTNHEANMVKLSLLAARFQMNWGTADNTYFEKYCKKMIDKFYHADVLNSFAEQLLAKKITLKAELKDPENKMNDLSEQLKKHESTLIDSAINAITQFKVGEIDKLALAKSIGILKIDLQGYKKPSNAFFTGIKSAFSPTNTQHMLDDLLSTVKKSLSKDELVELDEFSSETQKHKSVMIG